MHEYRVDKVLGQGGFGITYLASDINLNSKVAIKEYLPEQVASRTVDITVAPRSANDEDVYEKGLENYLVEARTLATFRHPHIVRVARFFEANNTAYMVLEYERGESLKAWWRSHAEMAEVDCCCCYCGRCSTAWRWCMKAASCIATSSPITSTFATPTAPWCCSISARRGTPRRSDRKRIISSRRDTGRSSSTCSGEQGPWTDIYALGATLYWMVAGKKPIEAPDRMVAQDPLKPAVEVGKGRYSPEFLAAIDWALKPETQDRPRDVAAFSKALFAAHPSSLNLQDALQDGEGEAADHESWLVAIRSPRLLRARLGRIGTMLSRPASWPLAMKMTLAMVLTALTPMLLTAYFNYTGSVERVSAGELRNLEQLAGSVAGRVSQLITDSKNLAVYVSTDADFVAFLKNRPRRAREKSSPSSMAW